MTATTKLTVRFPFPVVQTDNCAIEIPLGNGIPFPFLEPNGETVERFAANFGVNFDEHEKIVAEVNLAYRRSLILATARVS